MPPVNIKYEISDIAVGDQGIDSAVLSFFNDNGTVSRWNLTPEEIQLFAGNSHELTTEFTDAVTFRDPDEIRELK